jgi:S-adenosylmethionine:tRNA ribosyltransferase-isomerase
MSPSTTARPGRHNRLLVVDPEHGTQRDLAIAALPDLLGPGDLLVINDAATLPAVLFGEVHGVDIEVRLAGPPELGLAVLFGPGDWRDDTDTRPAPPIVQAGDILALQGGDVPVVEVSELSPRLVRIDVSLPQLYAVGSPVQYSYMRRPLTLSDVQTPYADRPVAVEMPSAGRPLDQGLRERIEATAARILTLTHAAGLSSTGDPTLDAALPLPERYDVPEATWRAVQTADRVIAVGTSVVRALESAARGPLRGTTDLRLGEGTELRVVDALLSGMHEPGESHFQLMGAFADLDLLRRANEHAIARGYRNHEFGDSTLVLGRRRLRRSA